MQKLHVESQLPVSPEVCWEIFESEAFRARLSQHTGLSSELLEERVEGGVTVRRLRFVSGTDLPLVAAKALGAKRLSYQQENRLDLGRSRLDWVVTVPIKSVSVAGATTVEPAPGGCRRVVSGDIEVRIPLVGGQIEKIVTAEFRKSMERAVELAQQMIAERGQV